MERKREKNLQMELAVKKASGDKSVYNFITGGGVVIAALGIGLIFTGVGLPIGLGMFVLGEAIALRAAYVSHQAQKDLDKLGLSESEIEEILYIPQEPKDVTEDDVKPQVTVEEKDTQYSKLSAQDQALAEKASGDKDVANFITGLGVVMAAVGIGLMLTGVGLPIGLGIFALGEVIAIGAGYVSYQAQKDLDSLTQKQSQPEDVQRERPQVVEQHSVSKAQTTTSEATQNLNLSHTPATQIPKGPKG